MCALLNHTFLYITYVHAHNVSIHTVPIKCCRWNGAGGLMEFELWRLPPQRKTMGLWTFQQGGRGRRRGWGRLYTFSLHHEPLFAQVIRTVCSYVMYLVTYMCIRGGTNIQHIRYIYHFKDLCVARCIHTLESGNCTSRGDWDGCHLSMITKRFDPI